MILDTVYVRHFRSFNFDFLRQDLTNQDRYPWDQLVGVEDYEAEEVDEDEREEDEYEDEEGEGDEAGELDEDAEDESPDTEADDGPEVGLSGIPESGKPPADSTVEEVTGESYYPFVKVRLERDITTVVGATSPARAS